MPIFLLLDQAYIFTLEEIQSDFCGGSQLTNNDTDIYY